MAGDGAKLARIWLLIWLSFWPTIQSVNITIGKFTIPSYFTYLINSLESSKDSLALSNSIDRFFKCYHITSF